MSEIEPQVLSAPFTTVLNELIQQLPERDPLKVRFEENSKVVAKCIDLLSKKGHKVAVLSIKNLLTCATMFLRTYKNSDDEELLATLSKELSEAVHETFLTLQQEYPETFKELVQKHALPNTANSSRAPELGQPSGFNLNQLVLDIYTEPISDEEEQQTEQEKEKGESK